MTPAATAADPADQPVTLIELRAAVAPTLAAGRPLVSLRTVQGWASRGVFGHRLRTVRVGGKRYTRLRWFAEFQAAVNGDTRTPLGTPGRPVDGDGKRRPIPTTNDRTASMFDRDDELGRHVREARARAADLGRPGAAPEPAPAADADELREPTAAELAERADAAKLRFTAAVAAGDEDAAARALVARMAADDGFRKTVSAGAIGYGRALGAELGRRAAAGDPHGELVAAAVTLIERTHADPVLRQLAAGACVETAKIKAGM